MVNMNQVGVMIFLLHFFCLAIAGAEPNPIEILPEDRSLRFPSGDAVVFKDGKSSLKPNGVVSFELPYEPKNARTEIWSCSDCHHRHSDWRSS